MKNKKILFLDQDGVLVDWASGLLKAFGRNDPYEELDQWNFYHKWGVTDTEMWNKLASIENFWKDLEAYPWADSLYKNLKSIFDEVYICSAPARDPKCWSQKIEWLRDNMGIKSSDVILTKHKHLLAKPSCYLLDDSIDNLVKFQNHGGTSILFKQPWNIHHEKYNDFIKFDLGNI